MKRFISWLTGCFGIWEVSCKIGRLEAKIDRLRKERQLVGLRLGAQSKKLEDIRDAFQAEMSRSISQLYEANLVNQKLQEALEATQEQLTTAKEITIPALVASHDVIVRRWEAESSVYAMRTANAAVERQ